MDPPLTYVGGLKRKNVKVFVNGVVATVLLMLYATGTTPVSENPWLGTRLWFDAV
jgi:hypothetical protein